MGTGRGKSSSVTNEIENGKVSIRRMVEGVEGNAGHLIHHRFEGELTIKCRLLLRNAASLDSLPVRTWRT
jgi:hypothetical protein